MPRAKKKIIEVNLLREIKEQPAVWSRLCSAHFEPRTKKLSFPEFGFHARKLKQIKRFIFLGCGSSAHASLLGSYYFEEICGRNSEYEYADEFIKRRAIIEPGTAVILLSQSGRTKDVLIAAGIAKKKGALLIALTNSPGSSLARLADVAIDIRAGKEMAVAASKSFSASLLTLFLLAWYLADNYNIRSRRKTSIFKTLLDLPAEIEAVFKQEAKLKKIAKEIAKKDNFLVIGRKYLFPIALEGAHKLKETAYIHAEGLAAEELRHGAEAMLDKDYVVIALVPGDELYAENLVVLNELKRIGVRTLVLSDKRGKELKSLATYLLPIKFIDDLLNPFFSLVLLQLLAYHLALAKGIDADKPRYIGKFVA